MIYFQFPLSTSKTFTGKVTGGTGAYSGATGTISGKSISSTKKLPPSSSAIPDRQRQAPAQPGDLPYRCILCEDAGSASQPGQ